MLIDGKKMACEACIRGHRVSGCQHRDRKLVEIAKKGRPVTQCQHCRSLRKSRSTHVKCECSALAAAKKARAQLKSEGEHKAGEKRAAGSQHADVAPSAAATTEVGSDSKSGSASPCSCCHGGRCTCALKKEPPPPKRRSFDAMIEMPKVPTVPSAVTDPIVRVPRPKARLQSTHSDTALMTFINGHHKPTHRYHSSIHGSSPYNIPTVGHTGHTFGEHEGSHKVQHTKHDGTSSAPPASSPRHRRHKSEHDSPAPMTYLAIPMASNPSQSSMITPLELTPRPSAPTRPTINRTSSGRIQTGLSVITDNNYNPYPTTFNHFAPEPLLLSAEDQYIMSANLDPSATSGWPSFTPQYENFDMFDASNPLFNSTAFCDEVRGYSMYNSVPIARTNASSDEFDPDYRNTSPPSLVSQALSNADSEDYAAFSAHSSYIDLPRLADVSEERTMSSVPEEPEQSIPTTRQHRNPFTQGYIPPVTATPATTPTGENVFNPFAVMYDNRAALKGINDAELMNLGAMAGLDAMGLGLGLGLGGLGGLEMGMQGMGMGGLEGVRRSAEGSARQEEFLYMGWG